jgi:hypothetical protein
MLGRLVIASGESRSACLATGKGPVTTWTLAGSPLPVSTILQLLVPIELDAGSDRAVFWGSLDGAEPWVPISSSTGRVTVTLTPGHAVLLEPVAAFVVWPYLQVETRQSDGTTAVQQSAKRVIRVIAGRM